jgi:hypothetical protein
MKRVLWLVVCFACGAPRPAHPAADSRVLRLLDGAAAIRADGSATENGATFRTVVDGSPQPPAIVADATRGQVLAFTVPSDASGHKQRIEYKIALAADPDGLHFDNARYAGFWFQLPVAPAPFRGSAIFWQAWQGFPYGPPISLKITAGTAAPYRAKLAIRNASVGPDSSVPDIEVWSGAVIEPGAWHAFLLYVEPRFAGGGALTLWIDGAKVVEWTGAIGYDPAHVAGAYHGLDIKDGIYQPDANDGHTFLFDRIVVATTFDAAAKALGWQ